VSSRAYEPHMVTMARGKAGELAPWTGSGEMPMRPLTRAKTLEIVGYSMPDDDVEIRTLLRAGLERGTQNAKVPRSQSRTGRP
jgi:hypothetical protein